MEAAASEKELFLGALERAGEARAAFLAELRARDAAAADRVEALLRAHAGAAAASLDRLGGSVRSLFADRGAGEPGARVGDYELCEEIASGASGVVWRARQVALDRVVALKVLRAGRLAGAREVERFRAEAEAIARLAHPNLVPVYDVGEHDGRHFFSMRYCAGGSLADRVGPDRAWEPRAAARLVAEIARAVHHAHQRGLLHRDLKPSNVLLDEGGAPCVADFGVAARIDDEGVAAVTATLVGTPAYMAPEQTLAGEAGELTVATDVWALGCILYELLAGRPPFAGETTAEVLAQVRSAEPFPLRALRPDAPRDLETIVLRCLAKEPSRRYASANALGIDLDRWLEHEPILARRTGPLERLALAARRSPAIAVLCALIVLLVVGIAIFASRASVQLSARLRDAYLGEARATRLSGLPGRRDRALSLLSRAAALRPGPDLRDEAVACLAMTDVAGVSAIPRLVDEGVAAVDGRLARVAEARLDGSILVRDLESGATLLELPAAQRCHSLRFSRDGALLAARRHDPADPTADASVHVFDVATGAEVFSAREAVSFHALDLEPENRALAVGTMDGRVIAWDLATGARIFDVDVGGRMGALRFRRDGGAFAIAIGGGVDALEVRAFPSGERMARSDLPGSTFALDWTHDGSKIAVGCADFRGYVYDARGGEPRVVLDGHDAEVVLVCASPADALIATSSWDRTLRLWDGDTGEELLRLSAHVAGFSPKGDRLAHLTAEHVAVARIEHGAVLRVLRGHEEKSPVGLAFSRDGRRLATYGPDGAILWDLAESRALGRLASGEVEGVAFEPGGDTLLLSTERGLERRALAQPFLPGEILLAGDQDDLALSADGRAVALRQGTTLQILDPAAPAEVRRIAGPAGLEYLSAGGTGRYVAGSTWKGSGAWVWDARAGTLLAHLVPERPSVGAVIAPDDRALVLCDGLSYAVHALPSLALEGTVRRELGLRDATSGIAFSEDGRTLALGLTQETVGLFDPDGLVLRTRLESPRGGPISRLAFSPRGDLLAASSPTHRVSVWDLVALRRALEEVGLDWDAGR